MPAEEQGSRCWPALETNLPSRRRGPRRAGCTHLAAHQWLLLLPRRVRQRAACQTQPCRTG